MLHCAAMAITRTNGARRLRAFRLARGMEPAELAQRLGIRRWSLVRLEAGQRVPSLRLAIVIEDATDGWSEGAIRPREWRETR